LRLETASRVGVNSGGFNPSSSSLNVGVRTGVAAFRSDPEPLADSGAGVGVCAPPHTTQENSNKTVKSQALV
jgi:hypothetical protein